jgi:hypothetical protein
MNIPHRNTVKQNDLTALKSTRELPEKRAGGAIDSTRPEKTR